MMQSGLAPPWVLFTDNGKPVAILPAMRPGEVCGVKHLTMARAQNIVRLANELHHEIVEAQLERIAESLAEIGRMLDDKDAAL